MHTVNKLFFPLAVVLILSACSSKAPKLGLNNGQLASCPPSPNCVYSLAASDSEHFVAPIILAANIAEARAYLVQAVNKLKRSKITQADTDYIRAEFTSKLFGYVDDVEFYLMQQGDDTVINVRSASRIGHYDFGANRKRVELLRQTINRLAN